MVEVTALSGSGPFYAGSALTIGCTIEIDASVDVPYMLTVTWLKSRVPISSDDRTTISNVTQLSSYRHEATLSLNPLRSTSDTGTYSCQVVVHSSSSLVQGASHTDMEAITIQGI